MAIIVEFALLGLMSMSTSNNIKKQNKINSYPDEAIYYKDNCIYINEEETIKININDIKKINAIISSKKYISKTGSIIIITKDNKKYSILSIKDAKNVAITLNNICKVTNKCN